MNTWHTIVSFITQLPPAVWVALIIANIGLTITTWGVARRRVRRAGERAAHPDRFADSNRKMDMALTVAGAAGDSHRPTIRQTIRDSNSHHVVYVQYDVS
jgi:hypothetical protein